MVVVAEGNQNGNAMEVAQYLKEKHNIESKVTIIGHLQRGGSPSAFDRVLASRLGYHAVKGLMEGKENVALGIIDDEVSYTPFAEAISESKELNKDLVKMASILSS